MCSKNLSSVSVCGRSRTADLSYCYMNRVAEFSHSYIKILLCERFHTFSFIFLICPTSSYEGNRILIYEYENSAPSYMKRSKAIVVETSLASGNVYGEFQSFHDK